MTRDSVTFNRLLAWKTFRLDHRIASVRYRCLLPVLNLRRHGWDSVVFEEGETLLCDNLSAIVFVKSFTSFDLALARRLQATGVRVILDLCDNIFVPKYAIAAAIDPVGKFREMACVASVVVVPTEALAKRVRELSPGHVRVEVIPDSLESMSEAEVLGSQDNYVVMHRNMVSPRVLRLLIPRALLRVALPKLRTIVRSIDSFGYIRRSYRLLNLVPRVVPALLSRFRRPGRVIAPAGSRRVRFFSGSNKASNRSLDLELDRPATPSVARHETVSRRKLVIWFGSYGKGHSPFGMGMISEVLPALEEVNRKIPLELIVVSNNEQRFREVTRGASFPATYHPWRLRTVFSLIAAANVCILPNARDEFSVCKSPNRAVLALSLRVPVVASSHPSLELFNDCTIVDDWSYGLTTYLTDAARRERDLARAAGVIAEYFSGEAVADKWNRLLTELMETPSQILVQRPLVVGKPATKTVVG